MTGVLLSKIKLGQLWSILEAIDERSGTDAATTSEENRNDPIDDAA